MLPADFWLKLRGHRSLREEDFRAQAELNRMQTTELINIQLDVTKRLKPEQLWKFPWDKQNEEDPGMVTPEENEKNLKKLIEAIAEAMQGSNDPLCQQS